MIGDTPQGIGAYFVGSLQPDADGYRLINTRFQKEQRVGRVINNAVASGKAEYFAAQAFF